MQVEVDGISIEYRRAGSGGEPTIVLLHEGLGSVSTWRDFPDALARATGRGVVAYSRWGYGRSQRRPLPWPVDHMEQEGEVGLASVLDALGIGERVLWGHSDGATIALVYAGHEEDPLLRAVVSVAAHVFGGEANGEAAIANARKRFESGELRSGLARHHDDPDGAFYGWADTWCSPGFDEWSVERYLSAIAVPTLVVQGTRDPYGTLAQVDAICAGIGHLARRVVLEGVGHHPHRQATGAVIDATVAFLAELGLSPR